MEVGSTGEVKRGIYRRIFIRSAMLVIWVVGLLFVAFTDESGTMRTYYIRMSLILAVAWVIYLVRDYRFLKNDDLLRRVAAKRYDERNMLITYKATRLTVVALLCSIPVAICSMSALGMQEAANTLAVITAVFAIVYAVSWVAFSRLC